MSDRLAVIMTFLLSPSYLRSKIFQIYQLTRKQKSGYSTKVYNVCDSGYVLQVTSHLTSECLPCN